MSSNMSTLYKERQAAALQKLLELAEGNMTNIARELDTTPQNVAAGYKTGRISKNYAKAVSEHEFFSKHLTKEELRPDIKSWWAHE